MTEAFTVKTGNTYAVMEIELSLRTMVGKYADVVARSEASLFFDPLSKNQRLTPAAS